MTPEDVYNGLIKLALGLDSFDTHVVASIFAIATDEAQTTGVPVVAAIGLDRADLSRFLSRNFPQAAAFFPADREIVLTRADDEISLIDLLRRCGTTGSSFEATLAAMIARRAQRPHHLWQDLGLRNRGELSQLMKRHFAPLAVRNSKDMKWKKFLYRIICRDTGYSLCTAPSCSECDDFALCFEEETGESLLARLRRNAEAA